MVVKILKEYRERPRAKPKVPEDKLKRKHVSEGAAGHAGPSEPLMQPESRGLEGTLLPGAMQAGSGQEVGQDKLQEYPPLGEVQLRGLHSNARSLVRLPGSRRGEG